MKKNEEGLSEEQIRIRKEWDEDPELAEIEKKLGLSYYRDSHGKPFQFTPEQISSLKETLEGFDERDVLEFIEDVYYWANPRMAHTQMSRKDHREKLEDMLKSCRNTLKDIEDFAWDRLPLYYSQTVEKVTDEHYDKLIATYKAHIHVSGIEGSLKRLISLIEKSLEESKRRRGRPPSQIRNLVTVMAHLFSRYFGRPTTYEDGPFMSVVRIVLEALELPATDPSRMVREAIRSLSD